MATHTEGWDGYNFLAGTASPFLLDLRLKAVVFKASFLRNNYILSFKKACFCKNVLSLCVSLSEIF